MSGCFFEKKVSRLWWHPFETVSRNNLTTLLIEFVQSTFWGHYPVNQLIQVILSAFPPLDTNTVWHLALGWGKFWSGRFWSFFQYTKNQCETLSIFNALGLIGAWGLGANLHVLTNLRFLSTCTLSGKILPLHKTFEFWKKNVQIGDWRLVCQTEILSYRFYRKIPAWKWLVGNREWRILDAYLSMWHGFSGGARVNLHKRDFEIIKQAFNSMSICWRQSRRTFLCLLHIGLKHIPTHIFLLS